MNHPAPLALATLNARFAIPERLRFMDNGPGLPMADIRTPLATARVALAGRAGAGLVPGRRGAGAVAVRHGGV